MTAADGDNEGALAIYRKLLPIRQKVAAADPANVQWQRDLAFNHGHANAHLRGRE